MSVEPDNVRVAITGAVSRGPYGTTAPTSASSAITGHNDLGAISEDGVVQTLPDNGDANQIKIWQDGATVRTIRETSDDLPTYKFKLVETSKETVEVTYGVTIDDSDGSFSYTVQNRDPDSYVVDVVDGAHVRRDYVPRGVVQSVGEIKFAGTEETGYEITLECEYDPVKNYNFRSWNPDFIVEGG